MKSFSVVLFCYVCRWCPDYRLSGEIMNMFTSLGDLYIPHHVHKAFMNLFFFQGTLGRAETSHSQVATHQNLRGAADKLIKEVRKIKHTVTRQYGGVHLCKMFEI